MILEIHKNINKHPYHLVDPSPWPLVASFGCFFLTTGIVLFFHGYTDYSTLLFFGFFTIIFVMYTWWRDVIREATYEGQHTKQVQNGLRIGMILFIISEIMFFFGFFWAFFHSSLAPVPEIGSIWPPKGIETINTWGIPLLNTVILITSGVTITWAHHSLIFGDRKNTIIALISTILLSFFFTSLQTYEYIESSFTISDGIYGSTFYLSTGFHGIHVIIGTFFIIISFLRLLNHHFTKQHHFGFEAAAWYWHFVDIVWLLLFIIIYWWGGR